MTVNDLKIKMLVCHKENYQLNKEKAHRTGENLPIHTYNRGYISTIYKAPMHTEYM